MENFPTNSPEKDPEYRALAIAAKREATQVLVDAPTQRRVVILLGRLEREINGYRAAIDVLTKAVAAWKRLKQPFDIDYAALLFNRACYKNRLAEGLSDSADAEKNRGSAWLDLQEACKLDEANHEEAKDDPDLSSLYNNGTRRWEELR